MKSFENQNKFKFEKMRSNWPNKKNNKFIGKNSKNSLLEGFTYCHSESLLEEFTYCHSESLLEESYSARLPNYNT